MKITIPMEAYKKCAERAEFKRQMTSNGFKLTFHEKSEFPYIWDMYDSNDTPIEVVTIDTGIRKPDARTKLLDYLREEYLAVSKKKFLSLFENKVIIEDAENPNTVFFNFRRLEQFR